MPSADAALAFAPCRADVSFSFTRLHALYTPRYVQGATEAEVKYMMPPGSINEGSLRSNHRLGQIIIGFDGTLNFIQNINKFTSHTGHGHRQIDAEKCLNV